MSAEDPSCSRITRASPSHQRNGHDDRKGSVSRTEDRRGSTRQTHPEHLSTGPTSLSPRGSCSSVPYIDFNALDSEYTLSRDHTRRLNQGSREQLCRGSGSSINGPLQAQQAQQEHFLGRMQYRESPSSSRQLFNMSHELDSSSRQSYQKVDQSPVYSSMADPSSFNRERHCSSPLTVQHVSSRSVAHSPAMETYHQSAHVGYAEQNGYSPSPLHFDESRYSPIPSRSLHLQKPSKVPHHSDADPDQGVSSPGHGSRPVLESRPVLSRAERMAALERRMVANGLSAPGRSRASLGHKRLGHAGVTHVGAVQMNDCTNTSGSESSESEVETSRGNCSSPMFGNSVEANSTSPIPRNKFSFGSLQLDEEADEDGCHVFSDEDGGQIFSC